MIPDMEGQRNFHHPAPAPSVPPDDPADRLAALLLERLLALTARVELLEGLLDAGPGLPDDCRLHECAYYRQYRVNGPGNLSHAEYHEVESAHAAILDQIDLAVRQHMPYAALERRAENLERRLRA